MNKPLSHLLKNEETLLDDRDRFSVADDLLLLLDDSGLGNLAREVVRAVEAVEVGHRLVAVVVVERDTSTNNCTN